MTQWLKAINGTLINTRHVTVVYVRSWSVPSDVYIVQCRTSDDTEYELFRGTLAQCQERLIFVPQLPDQLISLT